MKKSELNPKLKTEKGKSAPYDNIWFVVPPAPPHRISPPRNLKALAEANQIMQALPAPDKLSKLDHLVLSLFVKREAVSSSRIEGTWSTIDHVLTPGELFDKNEKSARASVLGYASTLESVFDKCLQKGRGILTEGTLKELHTGIMKYDPNYNHKSGVFRHEEKPPLYVTIGGFPRPENSIYNPTPPNHVSKCLKEILEWMRDDILAEQGRAGQGMGLVVRMAIAHSHFEAVHPFRDGNGRVGRMLLALQMLSEGHTPLYLSGFIEAQKQQYILSLQKAQKKLDYAPLIDLFSEAIVFCHNESQVTKDAILQLPSTWRERGRFRKNSAADNSLEYIMSHPIFTVKGLMQNLKVSSPAAHHAVDQLSDAKIIRERTGYERNRVFAAEEVITLLSRAIADTPLVR